MIERLLPGSLVDVDAVVSVGEKQSDRLLDDKDARAHESAAVAAPAALAYKIL